MGSKIITIKRSYNSVPSNTDLSNPEVVAWLGETSAIQSTRHFSTSNSRVYNGLGFTRGKSYDNALENRLMRELLQDVIGVDYSEEKRLEFKRACDNFIEPMLENVPHTGLDLEIGLKYDNNKIPSPFLTVKKKKVTKKRDEAGVETGETTEEVVEEVVDNSPINLDDWLKYKVLFENRQNVAENYEKARESDLYEFYIHDKEYENNKLLEKRNLISKAHSAYEKVSSDNGRLIQLLYLEGRKVSKALAENQLEITNFLNENPERFLAIVVDEDTEYRVTLKQMLDANVLYISGEDEYREYNSNRIIAYSTADMIDWMKTPSNKQAYDTMNARLREKLQKPRM